MSARRLSRRLSDVRSRLTAPGMRAPATLAAVAVALAAATGVLQWQAHSQRSLETARAESLKAARDTTGRQALHEIRRHAAGLGTTLLRLAATQKLLQQLLRIEHGTSPV